MQKIKISVLEKMIEKKLTSAEIDFIILISRYQNDQGIIKGVYYKEVCAELSMSYQTFYDIKKSLFQKGIIKAAKESYTDWDIQIIDNDFTNPESYQDGYINTNHNIFYHKEFFSLKAGEKLLAMQFLKIASAGIRGSYNIGVLKFYEKYKAMFKVTKRVLQNYIHSLKKFFSIGIKDKQYWITPLAKVYRSFGSKRTEVDNYNKHIGEMICRREKVKFTEQTLRDTADLIKQYRNMLREKTEEFLQDAVRLSLERANAGVKNIYRWTRLLQPKLVHKVLREELVPLID